MLKFLLLGLSLTLLVHCGGEDSSNSSSNSTKNVVPPITEDSFSQVSLNEETQKVSLKYNVEDTQGLPLTLESVVPLSDECSEPEIDKQDMSFYVDRNVAGTCFYEYTVKNHPDDSSLSQESSAKSYVLVSESSSSNNVLPPISTSAVQGDVIDINLVDELGADYPTDYILDTEVIVLGSGDATTSDNTITYTAMGGGVTRLLYSLSSPDELNSEAGYIDVAVSSTSSNSAPMAENFEWSEPVNAGEVAIIDVADFISDPDTSDVLQLTDVYAFNSTVNILDPDDLTNTKFTFESDESGEYNVSYSVTDKRGGWAIGIASITVRSPWEDILIEATSLQYDAPLTSEEAEDKNVAIETEIAEDGTNGPEGFTIPVFDWSVASAMCQAQGKSLPSVSQLQALFAAEGNIYQNHNWPASVPYLTNSVNSVVDLQTGLAASDTRTGYVTCLSGAVLTSLEITGTTTIPVYDYFLPITELYQVNAVYADGDVREYTGALDWSATTITPSYIGSFDESTQTITSQPQSPEESGNIVLNACTMDGICGSLDVLLFTQIQQIPMENNDVENAKVCEDIGYKSITRDQYYSIFNSEFIPQGVEDWTFTHATWTTGLEANVYGRVEAYTEQYISKAAYIIEAGTGNYISGTYDIILGTSYGGTDLICQSN